MSTQVLALLTALGYFICIEVNYGLGQVMTERPLIIGTVVGLFLGDVKTGVIIGAGLEVVFMGIVNIGGVTATDAATSTAIATAFAVYSGLGLEEAVAIAIPVGLVANMVAGFVYPLTNLLAPVLDRICDRGDEKGLYIYELLNCIFVFGFKAVIVYIGVVAGAGPVTSLIGNIPEVVSKALSTASGLLGAVGMAMLMRMLWTKATAVYFFLGFVLVKYFEAPTMAIAAIGLIIAIVSGLREKQLFDLNKKIGSGKMVTVGGESSKKEEEDFFS